MSKIPIGARYGKWVVLKHITSGTKYKNGAYKKYVECQCDCGTVKQLPEKMLIGNGSRQCKKCANINLEGRFIVDRVGSISGQLTVIRDTGKREDRSVVWECVCSCGNTVEVPGSRFTGRRPTRSCGCKSQLPMGQAFMNTYLSHYKRAAREREIEFHLTKEEFEHMTSLDCTYCGAKPRFLNGYTQQLRGLREVNGIDRVNSDLHYTTDNCVPCCTDCNVAKRSKPADEFKDWIKRAYTHLFGAA